MSGAVTDSIEKQILFSLTWHHSLVSAVTLCCAHILACSVCLPLGHPSTFKTRFVLKVPAALADSVLLCYTYTSSLISLGNFALCLACRIGTTHALSLYASVIQGLVLRYNQQYTRNWNMNYFLLFSSSCLFMFPPQNIQLIHHLPSRSNSLCY